MRQCKDCEFWLEEDGECHKKSPVVITDGPNAETTVWPRTNSQNGCGDFKKKKKE